MTALDKKFEVSFFETTALLGINISGYFDLQKIKVNNNTNWSFLNESGFFLACFGENNLLKAIKQLYNKYKNMLSVKSTLSPTLAAVLMAEQNVLALELSEGFVEAIKARIFLLTELEKENLQLQ